MTEEQRRQKLAEELESIIREKCYVPSTHLSSFVRLDEAAKAVADWFTDQVVWQGDTELTFYKKYPGMQVVLPVLAISPFEDHAPLEEHIRYRTMVYPWKQEAV